MTWANNLFYVVFAGQIFLLSYYFPEKLSGRMRRVLETYPPSEYPKLYPKPIEHYRIGQWAFKAISRAVLVLGIVVMFAIMFFVDHGTFADDGFISEAWPAGYGLIQFLPLMLLELSESKNFKLMRESNTATTRKAELRPRRLFDIVSPALLGLTVLSFLACVVLNLFLHDFVIDWGHDSLQRILVLAVTNVFFTIVGAWVFYRRKLNPHQNEADRARQTATALTSFLYLSLALSVFFMLQAADDVFDMAFLDATLMSLYFQGIALVSLGYALRRLKLADQNFDVYRNEAAVS